MYGVSWENGMNLANVGYVVNEVIKVNGVAWVCRENC